MSKNKKITMPKDQLSDHDLLIRLDEKFEGFLKTYISDMKNLNDGVTQKLSDHAVALTSHEKRLDEITRIIEIVRPEETLKDYLAFKQKINNVFVTANAYRVAGGLIGGIIFFILTKLPDILRSWGIMR